MSASASAPILVTGANGNLGRRLLARLAEREGGARAVVRSERAAATVRALPADRQPELHIIDYADTEALEAALQGCRAAVHLVGVIKESKAAPFEAAHEKPCEALRKAAAGAGLEQIVYLSIVGADTGSKNSCLASRGRAEEILRRGHVPTTILRVPMVIGSGDYAAAALRAQASQSFAALVAGGSTLQQPIDADDVVDAILACLDKPALAGKLIELAGPECLSHRQLVMRAAQLYGKQPTVIPIPLLLMQAFAALMVRVSANPPITPAMLGVLQHDDRVDSAKACKLLGIELTPLDETLRNCVGPEANGQ